MFQTWHREGIRGMYKGALIGTEILNLTKSSLKFLAAFKQTPAGVITYLTYEYSRRLAEKF